MPVRCPPLPAVLGVRLRVHLGQAALHEPIHRDKLVAKLSAPLMSVVVVTLVWASHTDQRSLLSPIRLQINAIVAAEWCEVIISLVHTHSWHGVGCLFY